MTGRSSRWTTTAAAAAAAARPRRRPSGGASRIDATHQCRQGGAGDDAPGAPSFPTEQPRPPCGNVLGLPPQTGEGPDGVQPGVPPPNVLHQVPRRDRRRGVLPAAGIGGGSVVEAEGGARL